MWSALNTQHVLASMSERSPGGYVSAANTGMLMVPGMMFTIEPMVNMGKPDINTDEEDGWTVRTDDGLPSAQWEVTVLVTDTGCEVICW